MYILLYILSFVFLFLTTASPLLSADDRQVRTPGQLAEPSRSGWAATYGGGDSDWASSIRQTRDGGYIVVGVTKSFAVGKADMWVLKLKPDGSVEWQKTYGGDGYDEGRSIQQTKDGGYIIAGLTKSFGTSEDDICVVKLRQDGSMEWQKTYGGEEHDEAHSVQQTADGGYIVAGRTDSFGAEPDDWNAWILKLQPDGSVEWQKTYGGTRDDAVFSIYETIEGGYIVAGGTSSFGAGDSDAWVLKLRSDGSVEWQKTYGGISGDTAHSILETRHGGYIVAGTTGSFGAGHYDAWVLKLKPDGAVEWQKTYGEISNDSVSSIRETSEGGYIVAGGTKSFGAGQCDFWVLMLRPDGSVEWQKTYGGGDWELAHSVHVTNDGGYIVAGGTCSFGVLPEKILKFMIFDFWILKLNPNGSISPSCDFIRETNISGKDSNATIEATSVSPRGGEVKVNDSLLTIGTTEVSVNLLCP